MNRREFLDTGAKALLVTAVAGIPVLLSSCGAGGASGPNVTATPAAATTSNTVVFDFTAYPALQNAGGTVRATSTLADGSSRTYSVTRIDATTAKAVSAVCTHQGCILDGYDSSSQEYYCSCHGSVFDVNGNVVNGPARTPLTSYPTVLSTNDITVTLS